MITRIEVGGYELLYALLSIFLGLLLFECSLVDIFHGRIPDTATASMVGIAVAISLKERAFDGFIHSTIGVITGFVIVWALAKGSRIWLNRDGIGLGDAKLCAAAGAWLGPWWLAPAIFISAAGGLMFAAVLRHSGHVITMTSAIPFGPFLSIGFFTCWCLKISGVTWFG